MLEISERPRTTAGKEQTGGLPVHVVLTHADGERPPVPRPCTWGHTSTLARWPHLPRPCTWGHTSTLARWPHLPIPCTWDHTSPWSGHHGPAGWPPNVEASWVPGTSCDGRSVGLVSSPHTWPRGVLLFSLWFCDILTVFKAFMRSWTCYLGSGRLSPFLAHWGVEKTHGTAGLKAEGQLWSLLSSDGWPEVDYSSSLTCSPSAFCPIRAPCNQFTS